MVRQVNRREFPIQAIWGIVLDYRAIQPQASPDELHHIALVKEWVKSHPIDVLLEALLGEENIRASLPPLGHTIFDDRLIPM